MSLVVLLEKSYYPKWSQAPHLHPVASAPYSRQTSSCNSKILQCKINMHLAVRLRGTPLWVPAELIKK